MHIMRSTRRGLTSILLGITALITSASAQSPTRIEFHPLFTDNMVLQREAEVSVWGEAIPGITVRVEVADRSASATADGEGHWRVMLAPLFAGGPHTLTVTAGEQTLSLHNVLVGDVWLASGQSNMEWYLSWSASPEEEVAAADYPQIRLITVPHQMSAEPRDSMVTTGWVECTPESAAMFSAVAYHFARELHENLGVPIGVINASWGGASMEAFTPLETLRSNRLFFRAIEQYDDWVEGWSWLYDGGRFEQALALWREQTGGDAGHTDPGRQPYTADWASPEHESDEWMPMAVARPWENAGLVLTDGVIWFRRQVDVPAEWVGRELELDLGVIDDVDVTFFNGVEIGRTGPFVGSWETPREYVIPADLVHEGMNLIAVRVFDGAGPGGMLGPAEAMKIGPSEDESASISLSDGWVSRPSVPLQQNPTTVGQEPMQIPSALYNAMIHPLAPFALRGVIWYQGETNVARHMQYRQLSEAMITAWRARWGSDFPFLTVGLAGFDIDWVGWPELQWAQVLTAREVPGVGMAVTADIGAADSIHPLNKREVGRRLALVARHMVYGEDVIDSGPQCTGIQRAGEDLMLFFSHVAGGLVARGTDDGALAGFEIAINGGEFEETEAWIEGNQVIVTGEPASGPTTVRYNWMNWPTGNLYNSEGLPTPLFVMEVE